MQSETQTETKCQQNIVETSISTEQQLTEQQLADPKFWDQLLEDVVDAVRERIKRRTRISPTDSHITHGGRQRLGSPNIKGRVSPKRKRSTHTQDHGRAKHGHDKSTEQQRRS